MTYKTAEKLKEAKFPFLWNYEPQALAFREYPSLSELIEACGDVFYELQQKPIKEGWEATAFLSLETHAEGKGDTPEEAVANLWLRLNDKK